MPKSKNALIRYRTLDKCFQNPYGQYTFEDLLEKCEEAISDFTGNSTTISIRTIREDIRLMRSERGYDAPIVSKRLPNSHKHYYYYSDKNFSIDKKELTPRESQQLKAALEIMKRMQGLDEFTWLSELSTKLQDSTDSNHGNIISYEQNNNLMGKEYLNDLYQYIKSETVLRITYQSFTMEEPIEVILHPYYLKQYNNRWFLFGLNNEYQTIQNLALDRIQSLEITKIDWIYNRVNWVDYFDEIVGVTNNPEEKCQKVKLKISDNSLPYVLSKPLHGSQKPMKDKNVIQLDVKLNYELESLILSFGENVEVVEPKELREKIAERVERMRGE